MNHQTKTTFQDFSPIDPAKFRNPDITVNGDKRASVALRALDTLWINTGTLCNITCVNCYIESSPKNDRLAYFTLADAIACYDEIAAENMGTAEIGFTGGEPFMNPDMMAMARAALERGFKVLILTNAMQPMQRPATKRALLALREDFGTRLTLRVSLDHYGAQMHEIERGPGTWKKAIAGLGWLAENRFNIAIAGRTCWGESESDERAGYARLIARQGWRIDPHDATQLVLFPEMDERMDVPEITTGCWDILSKKPDDVMCAASRMVVRRKGADAPAVLPCTLIAYDEKFEMGASLKAAARADGGNFENGAVKLNHPHCAKFCVLGGASCSR